MTKQAKIDRALKALLNAGKLPKHDRPTPTKKDLDSKFIMRVDRNGRPTLKEIE